MKPVVLGILKQKIKPMKKKTGVRTSRKSFDAGHRIRAPETRLVTNGGSSTLSGRRMRNGKRARKAIPDDHARRLAAARGLIDTPAGFPPVTRSDRELEHAWTYAHAIIEAAPPLLVLDRSLRVQTANESFCKCFRISLRETLNHRVYELGNGQWNIPKLRELLEEILPRDTEVKDYLVEHEFPKIGNRRIMVNARRFYDDNRGVQRISIAFEDITAGPQA